MSMIVSISFSVPMESTLYVVLIICVAAPQRSQTGAEFSFQSLLAGTEHTRLLHFWCSKGCRICYIYGCI